MAATEAEAGTANGGHTVKKFEYGTQESGFYPGRQGALGAGLMLPLLLENQGLSSDVC